MTAVLRVAIVALALATAYIHLSLGSLMFVANAAGYAALAAAMVAPIGIFVRNRWLVRAALTAFTAMTILGWLMFGARFWLAYLDKAIEVGLIVLLVTEIVRYDGGPARVLRRIIDRGIALARVPLAKRGEA